MGPARTVLASVLADDHSFLDHPPDVPQSRDVRARVLGDEDDVAAVAGAVGFEYEYVPSTDEYAHAAGIGVLTPDGALSRIFYGTEYAPRDVKFGLMEAAGGTIGSPIAAAWAISTSKSMRLPSFCIESAVSSGYTRKPTNASTIFVRLPTSRFTQKVVSCRPQRRAWGTESSNTG